MKRWSNLAQRIEVATRTSEKSHLLASALKSADDTDLQIACRLMASRGVPSGSEISWGTIAKAVEEVAGAPAGSLAKLLDERGDLGRAVEDLMESERPLAGPALEEVERSAHIQRGARRGDRIWRDGTCRHCAKAAHFARYLYCDRRSEWAASA